VFAGGDTGKASPATPTAAEPNSIVYVLDDDASVREGISGLLRSTGMSVECFASAGEFLARRRRDAPACLVLDVQLPDTSGFELHRELVDQEPLSIVFITGHGDIPMSVRAMRAGAIDFLPKPFDDDALLKAVELAQRKAHADWRARRDLTSLRSRFDKLTPREREVLCHVVAGLLNKQIAQILGIAEATVKGHRGRVMHKLRVTSLADLVRMAARIGVEPAANGSNDTKV
jgi:FixJ family two-component response regulator